MPIVYTKEAFLKKIEQAAQDISSFYQQDFVNYRGKTSDTLELYTELTAKWCIDHLSLFNGITQITREASYRDKRRDGIPPNPNSNRTKELIAMALYRQGQQTALPMLGKVLDYQTPLKNKRSDRAGKIDLLAYNGKVLRLLELKEPNSLETMLRCTLEGFTYLRTVNQKKLLEDWGLPSDTRVSVCPLVFSGGLQYREMQENRPFLKQLAVLLDSHPLYLSPLRDGKYDIL